jgi:magnesium-transporting ATPase (P-type)
MDSRLPGGLFEGSGSITEARTLGFTVLVLAQLVNAFCARSSTISAFHRPWSNRYLVGAVALSLALQVLVVYAPFMNAAFGTVPLSPADWLLCAAFGTSVLWADELGKVIRRARA